MLKKQKKIVLLLFEKIHRLWNKVHTEFLVSHLKSCGEELFLQFPASISQAEQVSIGSNVSIAAYVHLWGGGGIEIGNRVMIASHVAITSLSHDYTETPMNQTLKKSKVIIEDDVWIGAHSVVLPGVTVGEGAVVGAGSVVTRDVEPFSIVLGCPAKLHKYRYV